MAMRRAFLGAMLVAATAVAGLATALPAAAAESKAPYIVVFRTGVNTDQKANQVEREGGFSSNFRYRSAVNGLAARLTPTQVARLQSDAQVAFVTPDRTVQAVGSVPLTAGDTAPTGVRRIESATTTTARQASTANVAVIDTGVDLANADLNAVDGTNCVTSAPPPPDQSNQSTGVSGTVTPAAPAQDDNGHGTHVAGTIAAKNNSAGVVGVAPGTKIYAVKVLDAAGSGTWSQVICGIDWVKANATLLNIKVANMSLGGSGANDNNCGRTNFDAMHLAICNATGAGVTFSVAAGNDGVDLSTFSPANYPEVLAVTAVSDSDGKGGGLGGSPSCYPGQVDDKYATFSNYARSTTDINHTIAGPGVCITSTWPGGALNTISGTSMAAPHVTGSIALCLGEVGGTGPCTGLTPAQVVQKMRSDAVAHTTSVPGYGFTGDPLHSPVTNKYFGYMVWDGVSAPATPDFSLSASPASISFVSGTTGTFAVTVAPVASFSGAVTLTPGSSPAGLTVSPASAPSSSPSYSPVTFTASSTTSTTPGTYTVTVTGVSTVPALSHTTQVTVIVTAPPPLPTVPGAPTLLSAVAGNGSVRLTWTAPSSNGGRAITGYNVYRSTDGVSYTPVALGVTLLTFTNTGLTNSTRYYFRVSAVNVIGEGAVSNVLSAVPVATPPPPPTPCTNGDCQN